MESLVSAHMFGETPGHTSLCKFKSRFELQNVCDDFKFVNINIKPLVFLYGFNMEQYDVDVILNKLNFHLKVVCSTSKSNGFIRSLKIKIYNLNKQQEMASCTNFLQRRKNIHLALKVLRKCSKLFEERKLVLQTISDASPEYVTVEKDGGSGFVVRCVDKVKNFVFFESNWTVGWNYRNFVVFDFIDFMLNSTDQFFNSKAKPIMTRLTNPHNDINVKLQLWNEVLHAVQETMENRSSRDPQCVCNYIQNNVPHNGSMSRRRKRYKNLLDNKEFYLIHPEIIEIIDSDDDMTMEIDEDSDNDVEIVTSDDKQDVGSRKEKAVCQSSIVIDDVSD